MLENKEGNTVGELSSPRQGDIIKAADVVGHLLIVKPVEFLPDFETSNGLRDAIRVDVCDLNATNPAGGYGVVYRDALWFGRVLVSGLRRQMGELVCGWMAQGVGKPGQNPPFQLTDAVTSPEAVTIIQAWLNAHPEFESPTATTAPIAGPVPPVANRMPLPGAVSTPNGATAAPGIPAPPAPAAAPLAAPAAPMALPTTPALNPLGSLSDEQRQALAALGYPVS